MKSISSRLIGSSALILTVFIIMMGASISYSVHQRAETALYDRLQGLIYGIIGASDIHNNQELVVVPSELPDAHLNLSSTGLYADVRSNTGELLWQSKSSVENVPPLVATEIGEWVFETHEINKATFHSMQLGLVWVLDNGKELSFIVRAIADGNIITNQLRRFDQTLWFSLLASAIGLLLFQLWVLNHNLKPLKRIGLELNAIERGERDTLSVALPSELKPLASGINTLLLSERNRHQQHRHLLDDLAHSLKTPISVIMNAASEMRNSGEQPELICAQSEQMQKTLARYLQRASQRTPQYLSKPTSPTPAVTRIAHSLQKIYPQVQSIDIDIEAGFQVRVAEVDLYEMLGNILENACKYGATEIQVSSHIITPETPKADQSSSEAPRQRCLIIKDNGPGFPNQLIQTLTQRGVRADESVAGQGLGLASSRELLMGYGGELLLANTAVGGAQVTLQFP